MTNQRLQRQIRWIWRQSGQRDGAPRIYQRLRAQGWQVSRPRVARVMRQRGLASQIRTRGVVTTDTAPTLPGPPHLVDRDFQSSRLGAGWVSDITSLRTADGWTYLTTGMDLADRQIIGWAFSRGLSASRTSVPAWETARARRPIYQPLIFHSDRGVQSACQEFTQCLAKHAPVRQSMRRKGNCWDHAPAESFFKTLKAERMVETNHMKYRQVRQGLFQFIALWYNRQRRHSALDYRTPAARAQRLTQQEHT